MGQGEPLQTVGARVPRVPRYPLVLCPTKQGPDAETNMLKALDETTGVAFLFDPVVGEKKKTCYTYERTPDF